MHLKELDANLVVVLDALLIDASVTKAAERLGRSPSAVSHALANLRDIFDDKLFVRAGQRLAPTAKAKALAPTIHVIVSGMESLLRPETPFDPAIQERKFTLACRGAFELTLMHGLRKEIREEAPGVSLKWKPLQGAQTFEDLRLGKTHFLISEGLPQEDAADFEMAPLGSETYLTLARKGHRLTGPTLTPEQYNEAEHILFVSQDNQQTPFERHLEKHGVKLAGALEASSAFVGLFVALKSDALVTLPRSLVDTVKDHVSFEILQQPFPPLSVTNYLCWHRSNDRDECHEWLRNRFISMASSDRETAK